jgi:iron complex transport system ATP-binding protein
MQALLDIKHLDIGRKEVLIRDINCKIDTGALVILTGVNGCGKSTLLKTLANLIPALQGQIHITGSLLSELNTPASAKLIAFASTEKIHEDYIRVSEMIAFGRFPFGQKILNDPESDLHVKEAIQLMKIEHIAGKFLNTISDGEWQKANVARVISQNTPLVLMDEPTAFLDYPSKIQLLKNLRKIAIEHNRVIIVSTHDIELASRYGTLFWHVDKHLLSSSDQPIPWIIRQDD